MCNIEKTSEWRRFWAGVAVCTGFVCAAFSPSYGSVCLLGDEGCEGDASYSTLDISCEVDNETVFECSSAEVSNRRALGQTCSEIYQCPGHCSCTQPDCNGMGYTLAGFDFEYYDEYSSNFENARNKDDWPSDRQKNGYNDVDNYHCHVCTIGTGANKVHAQQNGIYYWRCDTPLCSNENGFNGYETVSLKEGFSMAVDKLYAVAVSGRDTVSALQDQCAEKNTDYENGTKDRYQFISFSASNSNYVCGKCVKNSETGCSGEAEPNTNTPSGCKLRCGEEFKDPVTGEDRNRSEYNGQEILLSTGEYAKCCIFREPDSTCHCDETLVAEYDPAKPTNAGCTGHVWENCNCNQKPCEEGSDVITDASGLTENAQGYWVFKKEGKCFAKKFVNWRGDVMGEDKACYTDIDMEADMANGGSFVKPCDDGEEFNTDTCECVPLECPEGWSIYAQTATPIYQPYASNAGANDAKGMIIGYTYKENTSRFLFGADSVNKTLDLAKAAEEAVAQGCSNKFQGKGWKIVYADENGKSHRAALKNGEELVKKDGKYQIYQCGYCAPKTCKDGDTEDLNQEYNKDETQNLTPESHCFGDRKLLKTSVDKYAGDERCVTCPFCWDVDSVRNDCYEQIKKDNLVTCWSEKGDRWGDSIRPICECAGTYYYENCYMLKPDSACSFFNRWDKSVHECTLATVTEEEVTTGILQEALEYTQDTNGKITKKPITISYKNPYIISQCQHKKINSADNDYVVAYISECTAAKNCNGHGPAYNPDFVNADRSKGKAMVTCDRDKKEYGVSYEGRTSVDCGGKKWFDECAVADACKAPTPEAQAALDACLADSSCAITPEFDVARYPDRGPGYLWDTDNGHPRLMTQKACEYDGNVGWERWYLEYCDLGGHDISEMEEIDDSFMSSHICADTTEYICGNQGKTMTFVFNKTSNGEINCTDISEGYDYCYGHCDGETEKAADGIIYCKGICTTLTCSYNEHCDEDLVDGKYCPGKCLKQCSNNEYCDGKTKELDGKTYCDGTCKPYKCANITSCDQSYLGYSGCRANGGCVDQVTYTDEPYTKDGLYVAGEICTPESNAPDSVQHVYALANCNVGTDCLGGKSKLTQDWTMCNTSTHKIVEGAESQECGGVLFYKKEDCIKVESNDADSDSFPTIIGGTDTDDSTVPEKYFDTGYTYTINGKTEYYYAQCETDKYEIRHNGSVVKDGQGQAPSWCDCGRADDSTISVKEGFDSVTCGEHLYAQRDGVKCTCGQKCNYDWTKSECEKDGLGTFVEPDLTTDPGCENTEFGGCIIGETELSTSKNYTSVVSDWCKKSGDDNWKHHFCGDMLTD